MDLLNALNQILCLKKFWSWSIDSFVSFVGNYGWAIILFIIALKLILSPLDYLQKSVTIKNNKMQAIVQPEIAKIQQKYGNNKQAINQKTMEIYKKHNYNIVGSCLIMLLNIALTLTIFISLFASLNSLADNKLTAQYNRLQTAYESSAVATEQRQAVLNEYADIKEENGWLWVKSVWRPDTYKPQLQSFNEYYKTSKLKLNEEDKAALKVEYEAISDIVYSSKGNSGWNGMLFLVVISGAVSFLSQWINGKTTQLKSQNPNDPSAKTAASTNKFMLILFPVIMVVFAFTSNAIFTLYIITNSIMSALISLATGKIINDRQQTKAFETSNIQITKPNKKVKKSNTKVVDYSRNYFKGDNK